MTEGKDGSWRLLSFPGQRLCLQGTNSMIAWPVLSVGMNQIFSSLGFSRRKEFQILHRKRLYWVLTWRQEECAMKPAGGKCGQRIAGWEMRLRSMINCEIMEPILQLCILDIFQRFCINLKAYFYLNTNKNMVFFFSINNHFHYNISNH